MAKLLQGLFGSFMDLQFFAKHEDGDGGDFNADDIQDDDSSEVFDDTEEEDEGDSQDDHDPDDDSEDDEDGDGEESEEQEEDDDSNIEIDLDSEDDSDPTAILKNYKNDPKKLAKGYADLLKKFGEQGKTLGDLKKQLEGSETGKDKGGKEDQGDKSTKKIEFQKPELGMTKEQFNEKFFDDPYENANKLLDTLAYEKLAPMVEAINGLFEDIAPIVVDHRNRSSAKDLQSKFDAARDELSQEFGEEFDVLVPQMLKHLEARPDLVKTPEQLRPFFKKLRQAALSQGKMETLLKRSKQQKATATGTARMGGKAKPPTTSKGKPRGQENGDEYLDRVFGTKPKVFKP